MNSYFVITLSSQPRKTLSQRHPCLTFFMSLAWTSTKECVSPSNSLTPANFLSLSSIRACRVSHNASFRITVSFNLFPPFSSYRVLSLSIEWRRSRPLYDRAENILVVNLRTVLPSASSPGCLSLDD